MCPVAELRVVHSARGARFVEPAHLFVELATDADARSLHDPERVVGLRREIACPAQVRLDLRRRRLPPGEGLREPPAALGGRRCVGGVHRNARPQSDGQGIGQRVVPPRVGRQPSRLRQHAGVEKHQDVMGRRPRPGVACPRPPAGVVLQVYVLLLERRRRRGCRRPGRAHVDDDDLEQVQRPGLACQRAEGPFKGLRRCRVPYHHAHGPPWRERPRRGHRDLAPVVVPEGLLAAPRRTPTRPGIGPAVRLARLAAPPVHLPGYLAGQRAVLARPPGDEAAREGAEQHPCT